MKYVLFVEDYLRLNHPTGHLNRMYLTLILRHDYNRNMRTLSLSPTLT